MQYYLRPVSTAATCMCVLYTIYSNGKAAKFAQVIDGCTGEEAINSLDLEFRSDKRSV